AGRPGRARPRAGRRVGGLAFPVDPGAGQVRAPAERGEHHMSGNGRPQGRLERAGRLRWGALAPPRINPLGPRDLNQARVAKLAAAFDLEQIGAPVVSHRGGWYYLIDGQHRIEALKLWLGSWEHQQVQCWCYKGLTEAQEAGLFLTLNDTLTVHAF